MKRSFLVALALVQIPFIAAEAAPMQQFYRPKQTAATKKAQPSLPVVVNAASYLPGVSPGALATIFGQDLTNVSGTVLANENPFPVQLAGVQVVVNGVNAPIFGIAFANGLDQISFQVPYEAPVGPGAVTVDVYNDGNRVASMVADSFTEDPGIFMYNGTYAVAVRASDYSLIGPSDPASPGEIITLYTTGLGPVTLTLQDGYGAPSDPLAYTVDPFDVEVNGERCQVLFSGLAPGFVGLYQINLVLPSDLPSGDLDMQIFSPYSNSGIAKISVQR